MRGRGARWRRSRSGRGRRGRRASPSWPLRRRAGTSRSRSPTSTQSSPGWPRPPWRASPARLRRAGPPPPPCLLPGSRGRRCRTGRSGRRLPDMAGFSPEQVRRFREAGVSDEEIAAGLEPPPPEPFLGIEEEPPPPPPPAPDEFGGLPPLEQAALGLRFAGMERVLGHRLSPAERAQEIGQVRRNMAHVEDLGIGRRIAAPLVTLPSAIGGLFAGIAEEGGTAEAFGGVAEADPAPGEGGGGGAGVGRAEALGGVVEADPARGEGRVVEPEPLRRPTPAPAPSRGPISGAFGRTEEDLERRLGRSFYENARSDVVDNITGVLQVLASGLGLTPTPEQLRSDEWWTEQAGRGLRFGEEMTGGLVGGSAALLRHPVTALRTDRKSKR